MWLHELAAYRNIDRPEQIRQRFGLAQEPAFALAQGQQGFAAETEYPSHK